MYFHAYFWIQYLEHLHDVQKNANMAQSGKRDSSKDGTASATSIAAPVISSDERVELWNEEHGDKHMFMKRLSGLSQTLQKVIVNIKKYPFTKHQYDKYVRKFAAEA